MSVTITSRSRRQIAPLSVTMADEEYGTALARYGSAELARINILNDAGRALHHRAEIAAYMAQSITDDQRTQIESLARAYARQDAIYVQAIDMGYGSYVTRAERGGMMPASWDRVVERASERMDAPVVTACDTERAIHDLGMMTESDREWSEKIARWTATWIIDRTPHTRRPA